jgi:hypothetical protein
MQSAVGAVKIIKTAVAKKARSANGFGGARFRNDFFSIFICFYPAMPQYRS